MKITKKAFIEYITSNESYFAGITRRLYADDELYCALRDVIEKDNNEFLAMRTATARSKDIIFSNGSYLDFPSGCEYHMYDYTKAQVAIQLDQWHDDFDNVDRAKALYYVIFK